MTNKHHLNSPSVLFRRELCPGSANAEKDLPEISNEAAERGTYLHDLIAKTLSGNSLHAKEEDLEVAERCADYCVEMISQYFSGELDQALVEQKLEYKDGEEVLFYGTADYIAIYGKEAILIDWKTGYSDLVDAEDNLQAVAYSVALAQKYDLEKVYACLYNPTNFQRTCYEYTEFENMAGHIKAIIKATEDDQKLNPGEIQCRFCKAALHGTCKAFLETQNKLALTAKNTSSEIIAQLSDDVLVETFEKCKLIDGFQKQLETELRERLKSNPIVAGYFLKERAGRRQISDINEAYSICSGFMTASDFLECCSLSVPKLEAAHKKATGLKGKSAKEDFEIELGQVIERANSSYVLTKAKGEENV